MVTRSLGIVGLAALVGLGCGDDDSPAPGNMPDNGEPMDAEDMPANMEDGDPEQDTPDDEVPVRLPGIDYPDSFCSDTECVVGGCDPIGQDDAMPACNAWELVGSIGLQSVIIADSGTIGLPGERDKPDGDPCPSNQVSAEGAAQNCCQRGDNSGDSPAWKLTGIVMTKPAVYATDVVGGVNKSANDDDRYNWVMIPDARQGEVTFVTGSAMPNTDGTFTPIEGPFVSNGMTFNEDGEMDVHSAAGRIEVTEDGPVLSVDPFVTAGRNFVMPLWSDDDLDFTLMRLPMTGMSWQVPLSDDFECGGVRLPTRYDLPGTIHAFLPLEALRDTVLAFSKEAGASGTNLCELTASVKSCEGDPATWELAD